MINKYHLMTITLMIGMNIQWLGHYLKDRVNFWLDVVPLLILIIVYIFIKDSNKN